MTNTFHKAARDGYLDLLQEASRRDCDQGDEDGRTPVLWAAFHGNLDALRLLVGRGGNPDKCDFYGSTALHLSAGNGHMNCSSFLVSFGANLWALDNDFHTPLDGAVLGNHLEIVKLLDTAVGKQAILNKKVVAKLKQKALFDAEKRVKKYNKQQDKAQKKAEKQDKKLAKERSKMVQTMPPQIKRFDSPSHRPSVTRSFSSVGRSTLSSEGSHEPKPYSAHFKTKTHKTMLNGVAKRIKQRQIGDSTTDFKVGEVEIDGTRTIRSLSGLKRDHHVIYVGTNDSNSSSGSDVSQKVRSWKSVSVPDLSYNNDSGVDSSESSSQEPVSMFERPGFGSMAFMNRPVVSDQLMSLPNEDAAHGTVMSKSEVRRQGSFSDSIGTVGSLTKRMKDMPWDDQEYYEEQSGSSPLETFLAASGIPEYWSVFTRERIDLQALLLLSDSDLKEIGLPMGPRRKLLDAVTRRKQALDNPGIIMDTLL